MIVSLAPGSPLLLAGVRDELLDRPWEPPGRHWPEYPGLVGGRDLQAGGTWLALAAADRRVACVLNGRGLAAATDRRRSRGLLPLAAAAAGRPDFDGLADTDPFHLILADPSAATMWSWDGERLTERVLAPGLHLIVNGGLAADLPKSAGDPRREREASRVAHFAPLLRAAARPAPAPSMPVGAAWGDWFALLNGDGIGPDDPRALIVRHDLGDGRVYGTSSMTLVALSPAVVRYDFCATPVDPDQWHEVPIC